MDKLKKCDANYVALTPLTFIKRAATVYLNRTSIIYEQVQFTWRQTYERCCRLASSLRSFNIVKGDVVSILAPNTPALYEMHFAVPMAGAILNPINTRLDAKAIATILHHSEAKAFFVDYEYLPKGHEALKLLMENQQVLDSAKPLVVFIDDICSPNNYKLGELEYEQLVQKGNSEFVLENVIEDEWDAITLNYTSGTTSEPKGVVYSHRGAYLSTLSLILGWEMGNEPVYLWTLPMFHCNGWTLTWGVAARGGTNVCIRNTTAYDIYHNISLYKVTHMCCAPIILNILLEAKPQEHRQTTSPVRILTGGAPPPASLLQKMQELGFHVTHAYGLTEATGPALVCEWQPKWNWLPLEEQAMLKARQGISILTLADVDVKDAKTMISVRRDGKAMGEIMIRGSSIMKGYLKDPKATIEAFKNGWLATGDIGVIHPDGYLEIKDRSKDVIISGGENISSVEIENVLYKHPRIIEAAVVAMPHPFWGESPCAFIKVKEDSNGKIEDIKESDILAHCKKNLPSFMIPKKVKFLMNLPKTSTGKIQKFQLRLLAQNFVLSGVHPEKKTTELISANKANDETLKNDAAHHKKRIPAFSRL